MIVITGLDGSGKSTFLNALETKFDFQLEILQKEDSKCLRFVLFS